jgi:hypothetical protein
MTYNINKSDGLPLTTIQDNTIDTTSTSLTLVGRNSLNYGQAVNQNFVNLLQNFANKTSPANPLQGQLWYDTELQKLRIYDRQWIAIEPPFDGISGTAVIKLDVLNVSIVVTIVENTIIWAACNNSVIPALLPDVVIINDIRYFFKIAFPNGLQPGINLAYDVNKSVKFYGNATSADTLAVKRSITLTGDVEGTTVFDNSSNITIETKLSNLYIGNTNVTVSGTYSKVLVDDTGRVIGGGNITNSDITNALGYTPFNGANINVSLQSNTVVARDENGNFAANIITGTSTSTFSLKNPVMIGINGDIIGAASFDGSNNIVITTQLAPVSNLIAGVYSTVRVDNKGRVVSGSTTADTPIGAIIVYNNRNVLPNGWALCTGASYTTPSGEVITTPNLSNTTVGGNGFYIMKIF